MTTESQPHACIACRRPAVRSLADFGPQPIGHHFLDSPDAAAGHHPIVLGQCDACGLAQLVDPVPPDKLVPRVDWIRYNEPEAHLDRLVDALAALPGIGPESRVLGITYKEDTSLRRFGERGFRHTNRLDARVDLGIENPCAGVEAVQASLAPAILPRLRSRHGTPDLVLVRHVIEHTHDTPAFLATFREWIAPGGYVVFELPDCARGFDLFDYTTFWEDHSLYFVESTFRATLERHGLGVVAFHRYPGAYEHCLVAVTQRRDPNPTRIPPDLADELARVRRFARGFDPRRDAIRSQIAAWKARGPVALFGAGHQASTFLSLLRVADLVDFVIDDHPKKAGRFMPGCGLPIVSSEEARRRRAGVWLSTVGVESERKIVERHRAFVDEGGLFLSIYPTRPDAPFTDLSP